MRKPTRRQVATFLLGPWMLFPQAFVVAWCVGDNLYEPPEMTQQFEDFLFLQGSTDWGGGCLFAGTMALYVFFGFTSSWYLALKLTESQPPATWGRTILKSLWILKFHVVGFIIGGVANIGDDASVIENDFRNMFLFAALIYTLSIVLISALDVASARPVWKFALAPLFTIVWLVIGSDGNTPRAGQLVQSGQDPQPIVRGLRHGIMLSWHRLCDSTLGDIGPE